VAHVIAMVEADIGNFNHLRIFENLPSSRCTFVNRYRRVFELRISLQFKSTVKISDIAVI
jgi:hypothetical protein